jgi:hypothetical protein
MGALSALPKVVALGRVGGDTVFGIAAEFCVARCSLLFLERME